jgi:hypothetical protein
MKGSAVRIRSSALSAAAKDRVQAGSFPVPKQLGHFEPPELPWQFVHGMNPPLPCP